MVLKTPVLWDTLSCLVSFREPGTQDHVGEAQAYLLEWKGPDGTHTMAVGSSWCGGWLTLPVVCYRLMFSTFLSEGQFNMHVTNKSCMSVAKFFCPVALHVCDYFFLWLILGMQTQWHSEFIRSSSNLLTWLIIRGQNGDLFKGPLLIISYLAVLAVLLSLQLECVCAGVGLKIFDVPCVSLGTGSNLSCFCRFLNTVWAWSSVISESVHWCRSVQALLLLPISCQGVWGILGTSAPKQWPITFSLTQ